MTADEFAVFVSGLTAEAREGMAERLDELQAGERVIERSPVAGADDRVGF